MSQAKRENRHYRANVDKGKEISAILERKKRKGIPEREVPLRRYKQRLVQEDRRGKDKERSGQEARESKRHLSDSLLRKVGPGSTHTHTFMFVMLLGIMKICYVCVIAFPSDHRNLVCHQLKISPAIIIIHEHCNKSSPQTAGIALCYYHVVVIL